MKLDSLLLDIYSCKRICTVFSSNIQPQYLSVQRIREVKKRWNKLIKKEIYIYLHTALSCISLSDILFYNLQV